jgi:hypothetical protein
MKDTNTPNRASNMDKAEGDRETDIVNQEPLVEPGPAPRRPGRVDDRRGDRDPVMPDDDSSLNTKI